MFAEPVTQNPQFTTELLMSQATNPSKSIKELSPFASQKCPQSIAIAGITSSHISSWCSFLNH
jgi:hypothetical protein